MMGYYGYSGMMGGGWGVVLGFVVLIDVVLGFVVLIDLVLLGVWLFKQINK
ncbi:hypothetical protein HYW73_01640 [Candidatus Nomurabacteria bacterium]|nr:hypothetical protein [Candidatus Nomurabacteria bacterium]